VKVLLFRIAQVRDEMRDNHEAGTLSGLLSIAAYAGQPDRLRIALYPHDTAYIEESLSWCDAVGVGATTAEIEPVRRLVRRIRERAPGKRWFIGGVHASLLERFDTELFDFMIAGEAERVVRDLVNDALTIEPGAVLRPDRLLEADELPLIDFRLYPFWRRFRGRPAPLLLSRGCAHPTCRYCSAVLMHRRYRAPSIERAIEQVALLSDTLGTTRFNIWDDTFCDETARVAALAHALGRRGLHLDGASCFCRMTDELDEQLLPTLRTLGISVLLPGFESGSDRVLKYLKGPGASVANARRHCLQAKALGMQVMGSVIFGSPTETLIEMTETLDFMRWLVAQQIQGELWPYAAQPLPGTQFWKVAQQRGTARADMDFSRLDLESFADPLLLDDTVPRPAFAEVVATARALSEELRATGRGAIA
jgi:radical SAM superfamily enzyme YgiQ (UPF0313 family)